MKRNVVISMLLIALAVILLGQGTYAYFSDSAATSGQAFSSGTLQLGDPMAMGTWSADITNLVPGDTRTVTVTIANTGTLPLQFQARVLATGDLFGGETPATASIDCGSAPTDLEAGASLVCNVVVNFPASAGNNYQGAAGTLTVEAEAHQVGSTDPWWGAATINGKIAFASDRGGNYEIYVMNPDGSGLTNLTVDPGNDTTPSWSPDGSKIAFTSSRDGIPAIYVMNADGTNPTKLTAFITEASSPSWSPDGSKIAFNGFSGGNEFDVYVMNSDGSGGLSNLSNSPGNDMHPAWSPDGLSIAFQSVRSAPPGYVVPNIYKMNTDGSEQTLISIALGNDFEPSWSPDGSKIAFVSFRDSVNGVYTMSSTGTDLFLLADLGPSLSPHDASWSPDGALMVFEGRASNNGDIYVMNADGSGMVNITNNEAQDADPSWQKMM